MWAGTVFILAGLPLAAIGVFSVVLHVESGNPAGLLAMACEGFLGVLGVLAIIHGIRSLVLSGRV
jgi:hypothetical protein